MRGLVKLKNTLNRLNEIKESLEWVKDKKDDFLDIHTSRKTDGSVKTITEKESVENLPSKLLKVFDFDGDLKLTKTDFKSFGGKWATLMSFLSGAYLTYVGADPNTTSLQEVNWYLFIIFAIISAICVIAYLVLASKFNEKNTKISKLEKFALDLLDALTNSDKEVKKVKDEKTMMEMEKDFCIRIASGLEEYTDSKLKVSEGILLKLIETKPPE